MIAEEVLRTQSAPHPLLQAADAETAAHRGHARLLPHATSHHVHLALIGDCEGNFLDPTIECRFQLNTIGNARSRVDAAVNTIVALGRLATKISPPLRIALVSCQPHGEPLPFAGLRD